MKYYATDAVQMYETILELPHVSTLIRRYDAFVYMGCGDYTTRLIPRNICCVVWMMVLSSGSTCHGPKSQCRICLAEYHVENRCRLILILREWMYYCLEFERIIWWFYSVYVSVLGRHTKDIKVLSPRSSRVRLETKLLRYADSTTQAGQRQQWAVEFRYVKALASVSPSP